LDLLPAIDLRRGEVVRLRRGEDAERTAFGADPAAVLDGFVAAGARWVHVVDLDAAFGEPPQRRLLAALAARGGASLQLGGGLRDRDAVAWALDRGFARGVVGSLAARQPARFVALSEEFPGRLVAALEFRGAELQVGGWREGAPHPAAAVLRELRASRAAAALVTDVERDGMLAGPNLELALRVGADCGLPALVSGGLRSLDDLRAARRAGLAGAVLGRALYEGAVTLAEALRAAAGEDAA
jgi:phosphoribosylformimino-5-aminoimidazole carboxamide ribotide isomerase